MSQNEYPQHYSQDGEKEYLTGSGLGTLLRNERMKKGLDHEQIFEITRLQPHILNSLENEDWDNLPSPVLVKGFIRSYARTIGLDDGKALSLYEEACESGHAAPVNLLQPVKRKIWLPITVIIASLAVISGYYLWNEFSIRQRLLTDTKIIAQTTDDLKEVENATDIFDSKDTEIGLPNDQIESASNLWEFYNTETPLAKQDKATSYFTEKILPDVSGASEVPEPGLILKANVIEGTWIRILIDDQDPKEYLFQPGSQPDWKAKNGFELLIGNAGGISFDLNGKKIENLGKPGQVVRIVLPENYKRRSSQD